MLNARIRSNKNEHMIYHAVCNMGHMQPYLCMGVLTASGLSSKQSYQAFVALYTCLEELDLSCKLPYLNLKLLELGNKVAAPNTAALGLICNKSANNYKYFTISHYDRPQATEGRLEKKSIMLTILIPQTTNMAIKQCGEFIIVKKD